MKKNWQRLQTQNKVSGKFWVLCAPYLVTDKSWSASQSIESHTTCRAHTSHQSSMQLLYLQLQNLSSQKIYIYIPNPRKSMMITKAPPHLIVHTYIHSLKTLFSYLLLSPPLLLTKQTHSFLPKSNQNKNGCFGCRFDELFAKSVFVWKR